MDAVSIWHICVSVVIIVMVIGIAIPAMICNLPTNVVDYLKGRKQALIEIAKLNKEKEIEVAKINQATTLQKAQLENEYWKKVTNLTEVQGRTDV